MAFKKKTDIDNSGITLGSDYDIDTPAVERVVEQSAKEPEPYNCLRKEKIIVRHVPKQTGIVTDKNHILYGGMARESKRRFVVPKGENGYKKILTDEEQDCLEKALGLEKGAMNVYKRENNFWNETNKAGINQVYLTRDDNVFDLSNAEDYIKYKILLACKNVIAPSISELEARPKSTYQFVIISEGVEQTTTAMKINIKRDAWIQFGKIQDDAYRMRTALSVLERKQVAPTTKIGFLQDRLTDFVDNSPKQFLDIVKDKYFDTRVTLTKALDCGIVIKRGTYYYDKETNTPLCENGEDPTIGNVVKYLNAAKNDDIKFKIESKIAENYNGK